MNESLPLGLTTAGALGLAAIVTSIIGEIRGKDVQKALMD